MGQGPFFGNNEGGGRWGFGKGAIGEQAGRDESARVAISREGIHVQLSCPSCSTSFVADEEEAKQIARLDPDDMRAESVTISWDEVKAMVTGRINNERLQKTVTGYMLVEVCPVCARHYANRGLPIDPRGLPQHAAQEALQRRREVSAARPLELSSLLRLLDTGKKAGVVV